MVIGKVPFGVGELVFEIPTGWQVDFAESTQDAIPLAPVEIERRLLAFAEVIRQYHIPERKLIFVFTDATRACPDQTLLEPLVRTLQPYGFEMLFLCAIGMHRPSTHAEKVAKLGAWIVENFPVIDHNPAEVMVYGEIDGIPIEANPLLQGATVVAVGVVEPHQYAGYSGGAKTVTIGCGGATTIGITHGTRFLEHAGVRLGNIENNPFQDLVRRGGALIGQLFAVNVVLSAEGEILELAAGQATEVHDRLVKKARALYETSVPNAPYDVVVAGVGAPKDANLYQASRAATYIGLSANPVIRRGGVIIVPAPIPEGGGAGTGERNFMGMLIRFGPTQELLAHLREVGCLPGEQRAFMVAQLRQRYRVIIVGAEHPMPVIEADLDHAPDMAEAFHMAEKLVRTSTPRLLVVPHALQTLPNPS